MSDDNTTAIAQVGVEQLLGAVNAQLLQVQNTEKQLSDLSTIVTNFVLQTLQFVSDNDDVSAVNEQLVSSLIQIKNFTAARPNEISIAKLKLEERKDALEQCILIMNEAIKSSERARDTEQDNISTTDNQISGVEQQMSDEKKRRILNKIDSDGKYESRRKIGHRPEKIRDIRHVEEELRSQKNPEEDI